MDYVTDFGSMPQKAWQHNGGLAHSVVFLAQRPWRAHTGVFGEEGIWLWKGSSKMRSQCVSVTR
jgi:hypothetical protein